MIQVDTQIENRKSKIIGFVNTVSIIYTCDVHALHLYCYSYVILCIVSFIIRVKYSNIYIYIYIYICIYN